MYLRYNTFCTRFDTYCMILTTMVEIITLLNNFILNNYFIKSAIGLNALPSFSILKKFQDNKRLTITLSIKC